MRTPVVPNTATGESWIEHAKSVLTIPLLPESRTPAQVHYGHDNDLLCLLVDSVDNPIREPVQSASTINLIHRLPSPWMLQDLIDSPAELLEHFHP